MSYKKDLSRNYMKENSFVLFLLLLKSLCVNHPDCTPTCKFVKGLRTIRTNRSKVFSFCKDSKTHHTVVVLPTPPIFLCALCIVPFSESVLFRTERNSRAWVLGTLVGVYM